MEDETKEPHSSEMERKRILLEAMRVAGQYFQTKSDPDQIPINETSAAKLESLSSHAFEYELDENGQPISWTVIVPTQRELAKKFLKGELTENQLFDQSVPEDKYKAFYLCSAFTVPGHRGEGLALKVLNRSIDNIPHDEDVMYVAWPFSEEGKELINKFESETGKSVSIKNNL